MKKKIIKILITFIILINSQSVSAEFYSLPEVFTSNVMIEEIGTGNIYYGGMTGNYAIFNSDSATTLGFDDTNNPIGSNSLFRCIDNVLTTGFCFVLVTGLKNNYHIYNKETIEIMSSKITADNGVETFTILETPALFLYPRTIIGDAYLGSNPDLRNFAFWGRNLAQSSSGSVDPNNGASWITEDYDMNPDSQSYWNKNLPSIEFEKYEKNIENLKNNAPEISLVKLSGASWHLQHSADKFNDGAPAILAEGEEKTLYPSGKVWYYKGALNINNNVTYYGKGTLIIDGNLVVKENASIKAANPDIDQIGIIVLDN